MNAINNFPDDVSYFETRTTIMPTTIKLSQWIDLCTTAKDSRLVQQISKIRSTHDKQERDKLKSVLPSITPSAVINTRSNKAAIETRLSRYSGWMQFDIDFSQNPGIDARYYREQIRKIVYVAFCGLSASGKGVWGLVKISQPDKLHLHFQQLQIDFASREVFIDPASGRSPFNLRSYSYDPDAYVAKTFRVYDRIFIPKQEQPPNVEETARSSYSKVSTLQQVTRMVHEIMEKGIDIAPDYERYRNIGFAFVDEFGEPGRQLFHAVCSASPKYRHRDADRDYSTWVKVNQHRIHIGTFFYYCKEVGVY
jgi:hypothetical protein